MTSLFRRSGPAARRAWVVAGSLVVVGVVVALLALGVLPGNGARSNDAAAATTPTAPSSGLATATPPPISPSPTGPTAVATALPPSQQPVTLDAPARVGDVTISLLDVAAIQGSGNGPGDVAGPALRVTVQLDNGTGEPLDLLGVSVTVAHGPDATPASPLGDPSVVPFNGTLEPGESAEGVYVFRVPVEARNSVSVSVGYQPGAPYAVFTGAV